MQLEGNQARKETGDPTVFDLKALQYKPSGQIRYNLNFGTRTEWKHIPQRINIPTTPLAWMRMFEAQLPISLRKFNDLQSMKSVMAKHTHHYFDTLPHLNV